MTTCSRCGGEKHRGRCKGSGNGRAKTVVVEADSAPEAAPVDVLEIPPGYGVRVRSEAGNLVIEQDGTADGEARTDTVVLTRYEALRVLDWISKFSEAA